MVENGTPLTVDSLRQTYRELLTDYFGPEMQLENVSDLEGLRIHISTGRFMYKYATGLSAAIALSKKVMEGGEAERLDYMNFLSSGGSRYPLESLKLAGIDMSRPEPVQAALDLFSGLVDELESLLEL